MGGWSGLRLASWAALAVVLLALLGAASVSDRWGRPLPGEATALMQAESLAIDLDLRYTRADYDRFLERGGAPRELALAATSGERITWDRPFAYAAWLAPFVRFAPRKAAPLANAAALALAALAVALLLEREAGDATALWIALAIAGSAVASNLLLARDGLFHLALAAVAFALLARVHVPERKVHDLPEVWGEDQPAPAAATSILFVVGLLLSVPAAASALNAALLVGALFAAPPERRAGSRGAIALGFGLGLLVLALVAWWNGGGLLGHGARTPVFTAQTGFPLVDFPAAEWATAAHRVEATGFSGAPRLAWGLDARLAGWNLVYLVAGRHGGLLVGFAPLLLLAVAGRFGGWRRALVGAAAVWAVALLVLHPFDLFGGPGAIGNERFLPLYGALWALVARRRTGGVVAATVIAVAALALPSAGPVWRGPSTPPAAASGAAVSPGPVLSRLPYETSQRWLPGGPVEELAGLWIRPLDDGLWIEAQRGRLVLDGPKRAGLMVIAPEPLAALRLTFGPEASSRLELGGATLGERYLGRDGGVGFRVVLDRRPRRHPLWMTPQRAAIHLVTLAMPEAKEGVRLPFRLEPELAVREAGSPAP